MIYLIGGPSRAGKTTLSLRIQEKTSVQVLPLDYIEAAVGVYEAERPFSTMRAESGFDADKMVEMYTNEEIVQAYQNQGKAIWKSLKSLIEYAVSMEQDFIIEGYQLTPKFIDSFSDTNNIKAVFLGKLEANKIIESWKAKPKNDWLFRGTSESTINRYAEITALHSSAIKKEAQQYNQTFISTDEEFNESIEKAVQLLLKS
jgi:2-phosphoglycerate kinase